MAPTSLAWSASSAERSRSSPTGRATTREEMGAESERTTLEERAHERCQIVGIRWQLVFSDVPTPMIATDEILVKVKSTAVNHLDLVKASGTAKQILPIDLPGIPGHEFSGVVEQIGSDGTDCAPGDAVLGTTGMGAYAEDLAD